MKALLKIPDIAIILLCASLTGFLAFKIYANPRNSIQVLIEGPDSKWVFHMNAEEAVQVNGPLGITVIRLHGNEAWVESSPCHNQICVGAGNLRKRGEFAACLPNRILLTIIGGNDGTSDVDAW